MHFEKPRWPLVELDNPLMVAWAEVQWGQGKKCQKSI